MTYGEYANKLVVIVDILDQSRVLIDAPSHNKVRVVINVKRLSLTSIKVDGLKRGSSVSDVKAAYDKADVDGVFAASGWGKKLARKQKRAALDDFGRFKVMCARMKKSKAINAEFEKLKSKA